MVRLDEKSAPTGEAVRQLYWLRHLLLLPLHLRRHGLQPILLASGREQLDRRRAIDEELRLFDGVLSQ